MVHELGELPQLDAVEQRVLGALMEKQRTVPASYPLSLNALRTACNQTSSREPVVDYDDATVETCARELKARELLRIVVAPKGVRTLKYHERLTERLELSEDEAALVTVLLLRGPQAPGELRTRTERLHPFAGREEVEEVLARLAARESPIVRELPRKLGQHDNRWIHLLGPVDFGPGETAAYAEPAVDREVVLADGAAARDARVAAAWEAVAESYADTYAGELADKSFDSWLLGRIASLAGGDPVADVGTGPGHVAAALAEAGADVIGYDLSPAMVAEAEMRFPDVSFEVGDLRRMLRPRTAAGWGAITAWYALVHLAPSELPEAVAAMARVLRPGGHLAIALHAGERVEHVRDWFGAGVDLDFVFHDPVVVRRACEAAGLTVVEWYVRGPLESEGNPTDRLYVLARKP